MINKYIKLSYRYHSVFYGIAAALSMLLFVPSLFFDKADGDSLVVLLPLVIAAAHAGVLYIYSFHFVQMIKEQTALYGTKFSDSGEKCLDGVLIYLTDEWLIYGCKFALCRSNISSVKSKTIGGRSGSAQNVTITTVDSKRYKMRSISAQNTRKIKKWKSGDTEH